MEVIWRLREDRRERDQLASAARGPEGAGLAPDFGEVGSDDWLDRIEAKAAAENTRSEGVIVAVSSPDGDWPWFMVAERDGSRRRWTIRGDAQRYVPHLPVVVTFVRHPHRSSARGVPKLLDVVLEVSIGDPG